MKQYECIHLVKSEDLNHHGTLFAARAAAWLVEAGFSAAACEHGNTDEIVLRSLNEMVFKMPVQKGSVIRFASRVVYAGRSSLTVAVEAGDAVNGGLAIEGMLTFVTVGEADGQKKCHQVRLDAARDAAEQLQREKAVQLRGR